MIKLIIILFCTLITAQVIRAQISGFFSHSFYLNSTSKNTSNCFRWCERIWTRTWTGIWYGSSDGIWWKLNYFKHHTICNEFCVFYSRPVQEYDEPTIIWNCNGPSLNNKACVYLLINCEVSNVIYTHFKSPQGINSINVYFTHGFV